MYNFLVCRASINSRFAHFAAKWTEDDVQSWIQVCQTRNIPNGRQLVLDLQKCALDSKKLQHKIAELSRLRNQISSQVQYAQDDSARYRAKAGNFREELTKFKAQDTVLSKELELLTEKLPNLLHPLALTSDPEQPRIVETYFDKIKTIKFDHVTIGKQLDLFDFEAAAKTSGSSFYFLKNDAVLLEQALVNFTIAKAQKCGWPLVTCPSIVRSKLVSKCGFQPRDLGGENQIFNIQNEKDSAASTTCLAGTAEIPLAGLYENTKLHISRLPLRMCGVGRAFRRESGSRGKQSKGLYRVHEFTKVELFAWTKPEESQIMLTEIVNFQKNIVKDLKIPYRVLEIAASELGASAYQKFDVEGWMPGRGEFGELFSASNCTDYQSRRLNITFKDPHTGKLSYLHTLNGTAAAIPRLLIAILENNYDEEQGLVKIPMALQSWFGKSTMTTPYYTKTANTINV